MMILSDNAARALYTVWGVIVLWAALRQGAPSQMTWLEDSPPWLRPVYCFVSINKNVTISVRFICFILTVKQSAV